MNTLSEIIKVVTALAPAADRYDTNPNSRAINLKNYEEVTFILQEGAGGTGTAKIQVEECSDSSGTNNSPIDFSYRVGTADGATLGPWVNVTAANGYTTVAGADKVVHVRVRARALTDPKTWARLKLTEVVNSPVAAGAIALLTGARYAGTILPNAA